MDKKDTIKLGSEDGAILFLKDAESSSKVRTEDFVIPEGDDTWAQSVRQTMAFFIYASQREDWISEFEEKMIFLMLHPEDLDPPLTGAKDKKKNSHLRLIK